MIFVLTIINKVNNIARTKVIGHYSLLGLQTSEGWSSSQSFRSKSVDKFTNDFQHNTIPPSLCWRPYTENMVCATIFQKLSRDVTSFPAKRQLVTKLSNKYIQYFKINAIETLIWMAIKRQSLNQWFSKDSTAFDTAVFATFAVGNGSHSDGKYGNN